MDIHNKENAVLFYHKTVMVDEVLQYLDPQPGKRYCDVTFGSGGHTKAILDKQPEAKPLPDIASLDFMYKKMRGK